MEPMTSTERIFLRLERDGFPIDVVGITVLESGVLGPVPFEAVRETMARSIVEAPYLRRRVSRAPLGIGESDANGAFAISVSGLTVGNRIGLAIGALPNGMDIAQTAETYFPHRGEGFQNLPNIGVFYDTTLVQP